MDSEYLATYKNLYVNHWWWRSREVYLCRHIKKICKSSNDVKILDVGCGEGLFFEKLSKFGEVKGVEPYLVDNSYVDSRKDISTSSFDENFVCDDKFDLILFLDVIEHIENPEVPLKKAKDLLKEGGKILITVPALNLLWTKHDEINNHYLRYTKKGLKSLIDSLNLGVIFNEYFFVWTVPVKLLIRIKEFFFSSRNHIPKVPNHLINNLLFKISNLERLFYPVINYFFGSSLILICEKNKSK